MEIAPCHPFRSTEQRLGMMVCMDGTSSLGPKTPKINHPSQRKTSNRMQATRAFCRDMDKMCNIPGVRRSGVL